MGGPVTAAGTCPSRPIAPRTAETMYIRVGRRTMDARRCDTAWYRIADRCSSRWDSREGERMLRVSGTTVRRLSVSIAGSQSSGVPLPLYSPVLAADVTTR